LNIAGGFAMKKRIALIFHEHERQSSLPRFAIWHLAEAWRKENIEVSLLFGVQKYVAADLALLHVDLTEVPGEYLDFAHRYPLVLNGLIRQIRKSSFSKQRVYPGDGYTGKIIVKSDLNYGGEPERKLLGTLLSRLALRITSRLHFPRTSDNGLKPDFRSSRDYRIYDSSACIPGDWFNDGNLIIERFLPEVRKGAYYLRSYHFLGNQGACVLRKSLKPLVHAATAISREEVDPDPDIVELTQQMRFDFGKFDYVMHEDRPVLLDTNKTPGAGRSPEFFAMCRNWARGIRSYL
jgi:hypothetical protein